MVKRSKDELSKVFADYLKYSTTKEEDLCLLEKLEPLSRDTLVLMLIDVFRSMKKIRKSAEKIMCNCDTDSSILYVSTSPIPDTFRSKADTPDQS